MTEDEEIVEAPLDGDQKGQEDLVEDNGDEVENDSGIDRILRRDILQIEDLIDGGVDFSVGDNMLVADTVDSGWVEQDLEGAVGESSVGEGSVNGISYVPESSSGVSYSAGSGQDFYNGSGDGMYNGGEEESKSGYDARPEIKGMGAIADERREGQSALERAGFEDKEAEEKRKARGML